MPRYLTAWHRAVGHWPTPAVVPACGSCNASKCNAEVTLWMRRKKLDERAYLTRQVEIARAVAAEEPLLR